MDTTITKNDNNKEQIQQMSWIQQSLKTTTIKNRYNKCHGYNNH